MRTPSRVESRRHGMRLLESRSARRPTLLASALGLGIAASLVLSSAAQGQLGQFASLGPVDPTDPDQTQKPVLSQPVYCYCVTHGQAEPCARLLRLSLRDIECSPGAGRRCGHVSSTHTPKNVFDATNAFDAGGYLTDSRSPNEKRTTIFVGVLPDDPVVLPFSYTAGQVTGPFQIRADFNTIPPGHFFLTPTDTPPGSCQTHADCTVTQPVSVSLAGLEELPHTVFTSGTQPIPWVRCGDTGSGACGPTVDLAYNWAAHPTVHWATPEMNDAVRGLAWKWYMTCSEFERRLNENGDEQLVVTRPANLVITDMSLPLGGLLDVDGDWKPTDASHWSGSGGGGEGKGHRYHRRGVDADFSRLSVPAFPGRPCGPVPGGKGDPAWLSTRFHLDNKAFMEGLNLFFPYKNDPNHVRLKGTR